MSSRSWIKIYCDKLLTSEDVGSDLPALGMWIKLLCIAGSSNNGDIGIIAAHGSVDNSVDNFQNKGVYVRAKDKKTPVSPNSEDIFVRQEQTYVGLTDQQIGQICHISARQWRRYKDIFVRQERITVTDKNVIIINNWSKYQSEYGRQKSYRQGYKKDKKETVTPSYKSSYTQRVEKENKDKQIGKPVIVDNFKKQGNKGLTAFKDSIPTKLKSEQEPDIEPF